MSHTTRKISESDISFMSSMAWMSGLMLGVALLFVFLAIEDSIMSIFAGLAIIVFVGSSMAYLWRLKAFCNQKPTEE